MRNETKKQIIDLITEEIENYDYMNLGGLINEKIDKATRKTILNYAISLDELNFRLEKVEEILNAKNYKYETKLVEIEKKK